MSRNISIAFASHDVKGFGELTRDSKYVDRHSKRLRADNGLGPPGINMWNALFDLSRTNI